MIFKRVAALIGTFACVLGLGASAPPFPAAWSHGSDGTLLSQVFPIGRAPLIWSDEFNELRVSRDGRGNGPCFSGVHSVLAAGEEIAAVPDRAYGVQGGILTLSTRRDDDGRRVEAHLQTADTHGHVTAFENGYIETRMRLSRARGQHVGLWLLSQDAGAGHAEFDVLEAYGPGDAAGHSTSHMWRQGVSTHASVRWPQPRLYDGQFHLFGVLATGSWFAVFYDRRLVGMIERQPSQRVPLYLLLSAFGNPSQPIIDNATLQVDFVRVYGS